MPTQKDSATASAAGAAQPGRLQPPPVALLDKYKGQEFEPIYSTVVTVSGGEAEHGRASGVARSDDGNLNVQLRLPAALGGDGGGTNPEQLFAAAYAACFHGALNLLAAKKKIPVHDANVQVSVAFGRDPVDGLFMLTADVRIHLPDVEKCVAEELVRSTERFCPYAKMARNGITSIVALAT
ncbi:Ohr subfamily peroxiredoxin [Variovorax boronicumulans]|uniref:Ohr family peroxiredoxin n=1 Tax=Variovorax boronicumulans TaxID=436515 RepID=UPI0027855C01|nr:Ohr family peroxiredoxin [Variovorax boronicumulans]MDP9920731.1 Ohr subfamily peroxiredoxin [Variovorax boronicumulans]